MASKLGMTALQEAYSRELKRTSGRGCTFAYVGGGWYTMRLEGDCVTQRQRWQRGDIERALARLSEREGEVK